MSLSAPSGVIFSRTPQAGGFAGGISGSNVNLGGHEYCSQGVTPDLTGGSDVWTMAGGSSV